MTRRIFSEKRLNPSAVPMMWSSAIGALETRTGPNSCCMPLVTLKTPPLSRYATSWPQMNVSGL
jgi:hypothetical protein